MLKSPLLFAIGVLVSLLSWTSIAHASDDRLALSFALPSTSHTTTENTLQKETIQPVAVPVSTVQASAIADHEITKTLVEENQTEDDIGLNFAATSLELPQPPAQDKIAKSNEYAQQLIASHPMSGSLISGHNTSGYNASDHNNTSSHNINNSPETTALAFEPDTVAYDSLGLDDWIFEGGSNSLVAHTVGSAEGTRHWSGKRTKAYYGHTDPGNGVWNLGTFSYQHGARSPEEADKKQLLRLKNQGLQLQQQATTIGIRLSLEEKLNGLDLANQAPLAALGKGGYIERLDQAYRMQMTGFEAISWARTRAYIDPDTQAWNAPGLGNNLHSISQDQERRMAAINKALRAYNRDENTVTALAKFDSISLEHPSSDELSNESDELSNWDIHLTGNTSQSQKDGLAAIALPAESQTTHSQTTHSQTAVLPADNVTTSLRSDRNTEKAPSKEALSLASSLSTLNFGLPPSDTPNTAVVAEPAEPLETEQLVSEQPSLDRLLGSANMASKDSLELQFAVSEEITLPDEDKHFNDHDLAAVATLRSNETESNNVAIINNTALADTTLADTTLEDGTLEDRTLENTAVTNTTAMGFIATGPSPEIAQIINDTVSKHPTQPTPSQETNEGIEDLQRFEDPISLRPVTASSSQPTHNQTAPAGLETATLESSELNPANRFTDTEDLTPSLAQSQTKDQVTDPNRPSRWRIRIEDRVINRK